MKKKMPSSLIGRMSYIGFFIDWALESITAIANFSTMVLAGSISVGIFYYVNTMVDDMKIRTQSIGEDLPRKPKCRAWGDLKIWPIYVQEIDIHNQIIGYLFLAYLFSLLF